MDTCHYEFFQTYRMCTKNEPQCKLWTCMIIMCQGRFINDNKWATLMGGIDNGKGYRCIGTGDIREISIFH